MDYFEEQLKNRHDIINALSDDVIVESIVDQVEIPLLESIHPTNYLSVFNERYNYLRDRDFENDDIKKELLSIKKDLYAQTLEAIEEKFDVNSGLDPESVVDDDYFFFVGKIYEFFVLHYREKLVDFFISYIFSNKRDLVKMFKKKTDKKDLSVSSLRKVMDNYDDVVIVANIRDLILWISDKLQDNEFIIETIVAREPEEFTNHVINKLFVERTRELASLGPDFHMRFFDVVKNETYNFKIFNRAQSKLMDIFPKFEDEEEIQ